MIRSLLAGAVFLVAGCGESPTPILGCAATADIVPDCRFKNPEDLAVAPAGGRLLVSQMGAMDGSRPGDLALYSPESGAIEILFPTGEVADDRRWGTSDCAPPDTAFFSPHGIDLVQRNDGPWALLVVNHGARESVELFEVLDDGASVKLTWRGCATGPVQAAFNDVEGRRDGGFYVSQMFDQDSQLRAMLMGALLGSDTGFVYAWDREGGFAKVPGSEGPFPNGLALASDEASLFINMYLAGEVRKLDLPTGEVVAVAEVGSPDNSTWASDGRLLVATHVGGLLETMACQGLEAGSCGFRFEILALDPDTLKGTTVVEHEGAPMGGATVAQEMDGVLYLGTFAGDRIARVSGGRLSGGSSADG